LIRIELPIIVYWFWVEEEAGVAFGISLKLDI
jgi:hypothetical protein